MTDHDQPISPSTALVRHSLRFKPLSRKSGFARVLTTARGLFGLAAVALPLAGCVVEAPLQQSAGAAPGYGYTCYAGVYVCRLPEQIPVGTQCSCPGIGAPSFGTVH